MIVCEDPTVIEIVTRVFLLVFSVGAAVSLVALVVALFLKLTNGWWT